MGEKDDRKIVNGDLVEIVGLVAKRLYEIEDRLDASGAPDWEDAGVYTQNLYREVVIALAIDEETMRNLFQLSNNNVEFRGRILAE